MAGLIGVALALSLGASAAQASPVAGAPNCPVFPTDNWWNLKVDTLPVASNSAQIINSIGASTGTVIACSSGPGGSSAANWLSSRPAGMK